MSSPRPHSLFYTTLDVFTTTRFRGNQLAVVEVSKNANLSHEDKQTIAIEFNYSETTFLHDPSGADPVWTVDIFTTEAELPFAGHPTIGAACYLGKKFPDLRNGSLVTKAGKVPFTLQRKADDLPTATIAIPQTIHVHHQSVTRDQLHSLQPSLSGAVNLPQSSPVVSCTNGMNFALFNLGALDSLKSVRAWSNQSLNAIITLDDGWQPTLFTSYYYVVDPQVFEQGKIRVKARMIEGLLEDPATGSAACTLAGYLTLSWAEAGSIKDRCLEFEIEQGADMGRASNISVRVELNADDSIANIFLTGSSAMMMSGTLFYR